MKTKINDGEVLTVAAPTGGSTSGLPFLTGTALFGIAVTTVAAGLPVAIETEGHYYLPKAAVAIAAGDLAYWDNTAKLMTNVSASNLKVGVFTAAAITGDASARVNITGQV
jgi:predicted RecA/RadA family phage recombinase